MVKLDPDRCGRMCDSLSVKPFGRSRAISMLFASIARGSHERLHRRLLTIPPLSQASGSSIGATGQSFEGSNPPKPSHCGRRGLDSGAKPWITDVLEE